MATGTAEAANTVACMEKDGWKFFLLEWEDNVTDVLQTELKCIWHDMAEQCNNNPLESLLQTTLRIARDLQQPSYFQKMKVPKATLDRCKEHNSTGRVKFTDKLLKKDEQGEIFVHRSNYVYKHGETQVLTKADQARFWAFTSYVINFSLLAAEEKKKNMPSALGS